MAPKNTPDERVVYLALKNVFKGPDAQVRQLKKIRKAIEHQSESGGEVGDLVKEYNVDNVCNVVKVLLEERVFESTLQAKIRFPEVFEVSPAQSAEREASEAEAERHEDEAIKAAEDGPSLALEEKTGVTPEVTAEPKHRLTTHKPGVAPSLFPVYLPFRAQHELSTKVQSILESACFKFGEKALPDVLQANEWDCPECGELNLWSRILLTHQDLFTTDQIGDLGKSFEEFHQSISAIRHTAVHRVRVSAHRVEQFMLDAESLARLLDDESCTKSISRLRRETQLTLGELGHNKHLLESKLTETLKKIATQRAELDRMEHAAIEGMLGDDKEYFELAGRNLMEAIASEDTVVQSLASTEAEADTDSDAEVTGNLDL